MHTKISLTLSGIRVLLILGGLLIVGLVLAATSCWPPPALVLLLLGILEVCSAISSSLQSQGMKVE